MKIFAQQKIKETILDDGSRAVTTLCLAVIGIVVLSYVYFWTQSFRGPSPIYFCVMFLLSLFSKNIALFAMTLLLPLAPALHQQFSFIYQPPVPFFIATPGIDICTGFVLGTMLTNFAQNRRALQRSEYVPWPIALALLITIVSALTAIVRNVAQVGSDIDLTTVVIKILQYKLIVRGDIYLPVVDVFTFGVSAILIGILVEFFKKDKEREETFLIALTASIYLSAAWGVFQAFTRFGLPPSTYEHRANSFFYGANGFQPDLHAFGALMLIGTLGLLGYFYCASTRSIKIYLGGATVLSWIALLLSKSRASIAFAIVAVVMLIILMRIKRNDFILFRNYLLASCIFMIGITALPLFLTSQFFGDIYSSEYLSFDLWNDALSLRPEFHRAAIRMFLDFPWFGAGQGNFIWLSADPILNYSSRAVSWKGDNAHNYFLQTLAELGLVGFLGFIIVFLWPLAFAKKTLSFMSAYVLIISIFLGNIYSHSLIVRENLFLLAIVVALIYSKINTQSK